jgi:hypothetical protein
VRTYRAGSALRGKRSGQVGSYLIEFFVGGDGSSRGHILHQAVQSCTLRCWPVAKSGEWQAEQTLTVRSCPRPGGK